MQRSPDRIPGRGWPLLAVLFLLGACPERPAPATPPVEPKEARDRTVPDFAQVSRVVSPGRTRTAEVFSISSAGRGNTQVMIAYGYPTSKGGDGVFAVELPGAPLRIRWRDDAHLIIGYPIELVPSKRDASSYRAGETVEIEYETFSGAGPTLAAIREHLAREAREANPTQIEALVRGRIVGSAPDELRYEYFDVGEPDSSAGDLQGRGFQGGGESWAGIVEGLITLQRPELRASLRLDPEGDILIVWSHDRRALQDLARLIDAAKRDRGLFERAVGAAVAAGQME